MIAAKRNPVVNGRMSKSTTREVTYGTFAAELRNLQYASKRRIELLTTMADKNKQKAPEIVAEIEDQLRTAPPERKLIILYVIDSVLKQHPQVYATLLCRNIATNFASAFEEASAETRKSLLELRRVWVDTMPAVPLAAIDKAMCQIDPTWLDKVPKKSQPKLKPLVDYDEEDTEDMDSGQSQEPESPTKALPIVSEQGTPSSPSFSAVDTGVKRPTSGEASSSTGISTPKKPRLFDWLNERNGIEDLFGPEDVDMRQMPPASAGLPFLGSSAEDMPSTSSGISPPRGPAPPVEEPQKIRCMKCNAEGHVYRNCPVYLNRHAPLPSGDVVQQKEAKDPVDTAVPAKPALDVRSLLAKLTTAGLLPGSSPKPVVAEQKNEEKEVPHIVSVDFEKVLEEVDDGRPINWALRHLKTKRTPAVAALYKGKQCTTCGIRLKDGKEFDAHLDMHFERNRNEQEVSKTAPGRPWFFPFEAWLRSESYGEFDDPAAAELRAEAPQETPKEEDREDDSVEYDVPVEIVEDVEAEAPQGKPQPEEITIEDIEEAVGAGGFPPCPADPVDGIVVEKIDEEDEVEVHDVVRKDESSVEEQPNPLEAVEKSAEKDKTPRANAEEKRETLPEVTEVEEDDEIIVEMPPPKEYDVVTIEEDDDEYEESIPAATTENANRPNDTEDAAAEPTVIFCNSSEFNPDAVMEKFDFPIKQEPMDEDELSQLKSIIKAPFVTADIPDSPGHASNSSDVVEEPLSPQQTTARTPSKPNGGRIRINLAPRSIPSSPSSSPAEVASSRAERTEPVVRAGKAPSNLCLIM